MQIQKYLGVISVALFVVSVFIILFDFGETPAYVILPFFLLSVSFTLITGIFSTKRWRIALLSVYGTIILVFMVFALGFGFAHM
ncbi:hypothetical protein SAMN05421663_10753 [Terribacillus halophilus]|uniref:DUF3953 domain-containing protein n=1 Tax=Terribacillus halophilus TaxID=361279 RepID=A0A1G6SDP1_9BACI|nr:hypothetical protein [Terribacillus halophilus]SDD14267.1 hypothetical protein SAMN05421663_10753 [Terribacillus halophilus]